MSKKEVDVVIIGAGAAGLMCAIEAGKNGRKVIIIDHAKSVGEKIRISGGGRCNFTNIHTKPINFLSSNPHFCKSALARFEPSDIIKLVEKHGIKYFEKTLGQMFCEESSKQIIDMLLAECAEAGVEIKLNTSVETVEKTGTGFWLKTTSGQVNCESLVIATGGKSIPKMGATGFGYDIAKQFGLNVIMPRPALVPLTFDQTTKEKYAKLAGVAVDVVVRANKGEFREALLFTHRGISGPAILQISSYWQEGEQISINLAPDTDILIELQKVRKSGSKQLLANVLTQFLPKRLAGHIAFEHGLDKSPHVAELSDKQLNIVANAINNWQLTPQGSEGFRTAEVTIGGVDTNELSSKTFEAKKTAGLYFIGEVVDVTGHLGGFNFQWAWGSGFAAGQYV